ncbi:MAG: DNA integrity scanning diadenylate cyclase DisA [Candidatus Pacearchaeota archaeon]
MESEIERIQKQIKEMQETLIPLKSNTKVSKEELYNILRLISPGTHLRTALDNIVRAGKGAIIAIDNESLSKIIDGGFRVNCRFTPQRLVELSKMDGAIILSKDMKKILQANVLLTPDNKIKSNETGTRHKAAERTAKQTETMVIAISERRHEIVLFYKNIRHVVKNTADLLRKSNEQMQMLEKHRELFDNYLEKLNRSELRNSHSINHAISLVQKGRLIQKIAEDLKKHIVELGNESTLIKARLREIMQNVEKETDLVLKDYSKIGLKKSKVLLESLSYEELLDSDNIKRALAINEINKQELIKGWRILAKTSLTEQEIAILTKETGSLAKTIHAGIELYNSILGKEKAAQFKEEIERIKLSY